MKWKMIIVILILVFSFKAVLAAYEPEGRTPEGDPYIAEYGQAKITGYHIPTQSSSDPWCHPQGCFTNTEDIKAYLENNEERGPSCVDQFGYCCLNEQKRGFYEEVKCQGTGEYDGDLYSYATIAPKRSLSQAISKVNIPGGDKPRKKRTLAVNPNKGSECYIPYGSEIYIDIPNHPDWSKTYIAEDTGAAFRGDGTGPSGNCKIDIFTGKGDEAAKTANEITTNDAQVYIETWEDPTTNPKSKGSPSEHAQGSTRAQYQHQISFKPPEKLFSIAEKVIKNAESCSNQPYQEKKKCLQAVLDDLNTKEPTYNVATSCEDPQKPPVPTQFQYEISGTVINVGQKTILPGQTQRAEREVTVQQNSQKTTIILQDKLSSDTLNNIGPGDKVTLESDVACSSTTAQSININTPNNQIIGQRCGPYQLDSQASQLAVTKNTQSRKALKKFLKRAADCSTSEKICVCGATHPSTKAYYADGYADIGEYLSQAALAYNFEIANGSSITTDLNNLDEKALQSLIDTPIVFRNQLKQEVAQLDAKKPFYSPDQNKIFLLHTDDKLAFLDEKPGWYASSTNKDSLVDNYKSILENTFSIKDLNNLLKLGINPSGAAVNLGAKLGKELSEQLSGDLDEQPRVPTCKPQYHHQTVCVEHQPSTSNTVNKTLNQAMSIPPLKFTVQI